MFFNRNESLSLESQLIWNRTLTGLFIALAALFILYWGSVEAALQLWTENETYQFHFLVLPISLYFIWLRRRQVTQLTPQPSLIVLPLLFGFAFLWLISNIALVKVGEQIAFIGMMQALILGFLGWRVYRALLFPLLFLWLMAPVGDLILPSLLDLTTILTVWGLRLLGIATTYEGTILITDFSRYAIVEACSARPFISGNLIICLVFANLMYHSLGKRIIYVVAGIPVAILANILRTTSVVAITEYSGGKFDLVADHATYGWIIFAIAIALQMWVGFKFADNQQQESVTDEHRHSTEETQSTPHLKRLTGVLLTALVIVALPRVWATQVIGEQPLASIDGNCPVADLPGELVESPQWQPSYANADLILQRRLSIAEREVDIAIIFYRTQGPGKELIAWPNGAYDGKNWKLHQHVKAGLDDIYGMPDPEAQRLRGHKQSRRLVWSWYWVGGEFTNDARWAKLLQSMVVLTSGDRRGGAILLSVDEAGDTNAAQAILRQTIEKLGSPYNLMEQVAQSVSPQNCRQ